MFVVSPDLVIRLVEGSVLLHTLDSKSALRFPHPTVVMLLFHFARPAEETTLLAQVPPGEREQVSTVIAELKKIGALIEAEAAENDPEAAPDSLVETHLAPLAEMVSRLAGSLAAFSPDAGQVFAKETGIGLKARLDPLLAAANTLESELDRMRPAYVADQLRALSLDENARNLKVHIGAGVQRLDGWVNIDTYPSELALDVNWGLPFADGAADYVFMSHVLEHLYYPDAATALLREAQRILAPGGRFRVIVPDIEKCLRAYVENDETFFASRKETWTWWHEVNTKLEDFLAYAGAGPRPSNFFDNHKFGYDLETLSHVLREAGFSAIEQSEFMASADPVLRVDQVSSVAGAKFGEISYSLFVEAVAG